MNIYRLTYESDFLPPMLINIFRYKPEVEGVITESGVKCEGFNLKFKEKESTLEPGTKVFVWLRNDFECASQSEVLKDREDRRNAQLLADTRRDEEFKQKQHEAKLRAIAINSQFLLPVPWRSAIKDVLSGLSDNSFGDGRSKSTVNHIYLLDYMKIGRIKRDAGDFLCTTANGSNGKKWSILGTDLQTKFDDMPEVTCSSCLKLAHSICRTIENSVNDADKFKSDGKHYFEGIYFSSTFDGKDNTLVIHDVFVPEQIHHLKTNTMNSLARHISGMGFNLINKVTNQVFQLIDLHQTQGQVEKLKSDPEFKKNAFADVLQKVNQAIANPSEKASTAVSLNTSIDR